MRKPVRVYNTLNRQVEDFTPLEPNKVSMYVCGVTVYGDVHLGHARCYITWDMVRRYLGYRGYDVHYVQNFTDVDDKIINKARDEGISPRELANRYVDRYMADMIALRVQPATEYPRATEHMAEMIAFIEVLIGKDLAYPSPDGDVFYAVRKFPGYGKLSGRNIDDLQSGARVEVGEIKRDPLDFALWKHAKPGEESWESPWGPGRPGWHIECSAMVTSALGPTIDIHAGGMDLIFPHHENEIAQSEGAQHAPLAHYWMHNGMVTADGQKMSKSLGNIKNLGDLLKMIDVDTLRVFLLQKHYRRPVDFSDDALMAAKSGWNRLRRSMAEIAQAPGGTDAEQGAKIEQVLAESRHRFETHMDDDFDTPGAVAVLFELVRQLHPFRLAPTETLQKGVALTQELAGILGLSLEPEAATGGDDALRPIMDVLIALRKEARAAKNFALSDVIRDKLAAGQLVLEDKPGNVTTWRPTEESTASDLTDAAVQVLIALRQEARANKDFAMSDAIRDRLQAIGIVLEDKAGGQTGWRIIEAATAQL
ncbi:MAG: cysteine--tRNA ligase [Candidatus Sericytochromatia bacterium]|nr:cysteine--tRNA ligase [Candidatus Sericytochromatia bacterium]